MLTLNNSQRAVIAKLSGVAHNSLIVAQLLVRNDFRCRLSRSSAHYKCLQEPPLSCGFTQKIL